MKLERLTWWSRYNRLRDQLKYKQLHPSADATLGATPYHMLRYATRLEDALRRPALRFDPQWDEPMQRLLNPERP